MKTKTSHTKSKNLQKAKKPAKKIPKTPKKKVHTKEQIVEDVDLEHYIELDEDKILEEIEKEAIIEEEPLGNLEEDLDEEDGVVKKQHGSNNIPTGYQPMEPPTIHTNTLNKNYIDPVRLRDLIIEFYKTEIIVDELAICLYNICQRLSYRPNFIQYTWKESMVGDAIQKVFQALKNKKYNPHNKEGNAFTYFSMIAFYAFCNRIKKEKKEQETVHKYQNDTFDDAFHNCEVTHDD